MNSQYSQNKIWCKFKEKLKTLISFKFNQINSQNDYELLSYGLFELEVYWLHSYMPKKNNVSTEL